MRLVSKVFVLPSQVACPSVPSLKLRALRGHRGSTHTLNTIQRSPMSTQVPCFVATLPPILDAYSGDPDEHRSQVRGNPFRFASPRGVATPSARCRRPKVPSPRLAC